jgi:copper chaperone
MASLRLKITGMSCAHCRMSVEKALAQVPGVYAAVVDLQDASAQVDYDDDTATIEELTAAVAKAGYSAVVDG